jgi:hypothetical protein
VEKLITIVGLLATVFSCVIALLTLRYPQEITRIVYLVADQTPQLQPQPIITVLVEPTPVPPTPAPSPTTGPSPTPVPTETPVPTISSQDAMATFEAEGQFATATSVCATAQAKDALRLAVTPAPGVPIYIPFPTHTSSIYTEFPLAEGVKYMLVAEGSFFGGSSNANDDQFGDAQYKWTEDTCCTFHPNLEIDGEIRVADVQDLENHTYVYYYRGTGHPVEFRLPDIYKGMFGRWGGVDGGVTVKIYVYDWGMPCP